MKASPLLTLLTIGLLFSCSFGCERPQRADSPSPHPSQPRNLAEITPDDPETASDAPRASALVRYLEDIDGEGPLFADIETTHGTIICELFDELAPITVSNFVGLARGLKAFVDPETGEAVSGVPFYADVIFHRVVPDFLIQAGDPTGTGHHGPGYTIPDEISPVLRHDQPGILSMANQGPNTAGSQFFITEKAAPHLDDRHTVFGHCPSANVIRSISHMPTQSLNRPVDPAPRILSISFRFGED